MNYDAPMVETSINKIAKYLNINDIKTVFEIGAYDGVDIELILNLFKSSVVHTFEPDIECYKNIEKLFSNNFRVKNNNIALTNKTGEISFFKCLDPHTSEQKERSTWHKTAQSLLHNSNFHIGGRAVLEQEVIVPCQTIDNYCTDNNIQPEVLLIDTQGSEYQILEGAKNTLKHVKAILTEWSTKELYTNQKLLPEIQQLLHDYNFELVEKINLWENFHGDAIFIKK